MVAGILNGFRKYDGIMPVGATCSVCVSAACHNEDDPKEEAWLGPLTWGDVSRDWNRGQVRHLTFTSLFAQKPIEGDLYS